MRLQDIAARRGCKIPRKGIPESNDWQKRRVDLFLTCNHLSNALLSLHSRSQWCGILNQVKKCKRRQLPILAPPFVVMVNTWPDLSFVSVENKLICHQSTENNGQLATLA